MSAKVLVTSNAAGSAIDWRGGQGSFSASGGFASCSLALEASVDGGVSWFAVNDSEGSPLALTANGSLSFNIAPCKLRFVSTGATVAAGAGQVVTMTCTGPDVLADSGVIVLTVVSALFAEPLVLSVPALAGDTPELCASRVREVLQRRPETSFRFLTSGEGADVVMTVRAPYLANDGTLSLSINNSDDELPGIEAADSVDTTVGEVQTPSVVVSVSVASGSAAVDSSTTGGANKIVKLSGTGVLKTLPTNTVAGSNPGAAWRIVAGQRIEWEGLDGNTCANVWMFPNHGSSHDANAYPELVWSAARYCYYWIDGFQMGDSPQTGTQRGWRFMYFNPLGKAHAPGTYLAGSLDSVCESIATQWGGSWWDGDEAIDSTASMQYVPDGVASGELCYYIGGAAQPGGASAYGRILASSGHVKVFGLIPAGPKIPTGKTITFAGDLSFTVGAIEVVKADLASAIANTLRMSNGKTRIGGSGNMTGVAAYPFEVAPHIAGITQTSGDLYVDVNGCVFVGRTTTTSGGGSGKQIWQGRTGNAQITFDAGGSGTTPAATFACGTSFTLTTDSTSSTTGAVKISGGVGIAKKLFVGTGFNLAAPTVPASAIASGTAGDIAWDASYIYVCTATNTWKRAAISTW